MSKKKNAHCWKCGKTLPRISGFELSTCRENGLVHDYIPVKIANDFPINGKISDLMLASTSLPFEETIKALQEQEIQQKGGRRDGRNDLQEGGSGY